MAKEIEVKKKARIKESGSMDVLGYLNKPYTKCSKHNKSKTLLIKIGRDKSYRFLRYNNLLIEKRKNYITTTNSNHMYKKYKNLAKDHVPTRPEQLWGSDITYTNTENGHNYLALVTEAYSKKIMGYKLDNHMRTSLYKEALDIAIKNRKHHNQKLIHHSDKGI
ncbi:DDE-type integrase/transposase/recombinase [Flavobacteriaceae bacterium GSB9]|nr:DDE-type integrase/transposase/recombinase [Flavobacteriaceae bacterium GSB9]